MADSCSFFKLFSLLPVSEDNMTEAYPEDPKELVMVPLIEASKEIDKPE